MALVIRLLIAVALLGGAYYLYEKMPKATRAVEEDMVMPGQEHFTAAEHSVPQDEKSKSLGSAGETVFYFGGIVVLSLTGAAVLGLTILPLMGNALASVFYSEASTHVEKTPHSAALAKCAQGDYEAAVTEFEKVFANDPSDIHALMEIVRLSRDKLEAPERAAAALEGALQEERAPDETAQVVFRLADLYNHDLLDQARAIAVLQQIAELMPDTPHALTAYHKLAEIQSGITRG